MTGGQFVVCASGSRLSRAVETLARWWTQAPQAQRFALVKASIEGHEGAPPYAQLQVAIYLAEIANGEVEEG